MTTRKDRVGKLALVLALIAVFAAGTTAAQARQSGSSTRNLTTTARIFTVVERAKNDVVVYVNKKAQDDVVGNTLGFGNKLYNATNRKVVGRDQGFCYRTNPGKYWECTFTNVLGDGRLTVQGVFPDSLRDSKMAITGGTGAYRDARGFMILHARNEAGTVYSFEFHVL